MASVQVKNDRYYFVYYDPMTGKHRWKSSGIPVDPKNPMKSEVKANMALGEFMAKVDGRVVEETTAPMVERKNVPSGTFFHDLLPLWLADKKKHVRTDTYDGYEQFVRCHLVPYFKLHPVTVQDIDEKDLQACVDALLEKGLSINTVYKQRALLGDALYFASTQKLISGRDYLKGVKIPTVPKYNSNFYNTEQIDTLLQNNRDSIYYPALYLAAKLGLRRSEVCGLRWSSIDLVNKTVKINSTAIVTKSEGLVLSGMTKTEKSGRPLPLTTKVIAYLKDLKRQQTESRLFFGAQYSKDYLDYVCVLADGTLINPDCITYALNRYSKKLTATLGYPHVRFHDLRHSFATNLIRDGVNIKVVSKMLGHSTEATTLRIYYHVLPEDFANALKAQDEKMAM